jgi:hypothetical protein
MIVPMALKLISMLGCGQTLTLFVSSPNDLR